jgi:hypothetical protein
MLNARNQRGHDSTLTAARFQVFKVRKVDRSTPPEIAVKTFKVRRVTVNTRRRSGITRTAILKRPDGQRKRVRD